MFFRKVIISLFCSIAFIFLFAFIIRIFNHKQGLQRVEVTDSLGNVTEVYYEQHGFLGLNDFVSYIETINFNETIEKFKNDINRFKNDFQAIFDGENNESWILDVVKFIADIILLPFYLTYDVVYFLYYFFKIFFDFIYWLIAFEGYNPITTTTI